jgi:hypothetical protein
MRVVSFHPCLLNSHFSLYTEWWKSYTAFLLFNVPRQVTFAPLCIAGCKCKFYEPVSIDWEPLYIVRLIISHAVVNSRDFPQAYKKTQCVFRICYKPQKKRSDNKHNKIVINFTAVELSRESQTHSTVFLIDCTSLIGILLAKILFHEK